MRAVVAIVVVASLIGALVDGTRAQSLGVVSYPAGWNLVAGPEGTVFAGAVGPLYTLQAGDAAYRTSLPATPVRGGNGYWAYFPQVTAIRLAGTARLPQSIQLPAGQYVLIGNPANEPVSVSTGADLLLSYDPVGHGYVSTTVLLPGQGAWAYSIDGVALTLSSLTPPAPPSVPVASPSPTSSPVPRLSPPAAPQGLHATALDGTRVRVDWQQVIGATGYVLLDATDRHQIAAPAADATTFTLVNLVPNSQYCVVIYAFNAAGASPPSDQACAQTPAG